MAAPREQVGQDLKGKVNEAGRKGAERGGQQRGPAQPAGGG